MKAKRMITVMTAAVLSAGMLASCSEAELMYLDFTKDIAQWNVFSGTGEMVVELNNEMLASFMNDVSADDSSISASDIPFEKLSMVYTASADYDSNIYDIDFDIAVDDNTPYNLSFYVDTEKVIFDKSILDSAKQFINDYNITDGNISITLDFMDEYFKDYDSIEIPYEYSMTNIGFTDSSMSREFIKAICDFMITAFDGYETSSYELNGANGVKAVFNYDNVVKAVSDLFDYYINNTDKINAAWNDFNITLSDIMSSMYPDNYNSNEPIKLPTVDEAREMQMQFNALVNDKSFYPLKELLMNSEYGFEVERISDTSYKSDSYMDLNYKGNDFADITVAETNNKLEQLEKKEYNSYVFTNENDKKFNEDFNNWLDENHPVNSADISWYKGDNYCVISYIRDNDYSSVDHALLINIDDYIYVPMRQFVEGLGYTVEWDDNNNKAYIINDNEKFYPATILVGDSSFIKVRDLEKIGLKVEYKEGEDGLGIIECTALVDKAA